MRKIYIFNIIFIFLLIISCLLSASVILDATYILPRVWQRQSQKTPWLENINSLFSKSKDNEIFYNTFRVSNSNSIKITVNSMKNTSFSEQLWFTRNSNYRYTSQEVFVIEFNGLQGNLHRNYYIKPDSKYLHVSFSIQINSSQSTPCGFFFVSKPNSYPFFCATEKVDIAKKTKINLLIPLNGIYGSKFVTLGFHSDFKSIFKIEKFTVKQISKTYASTRTPFTPFPVEFSCIDLTSNDFLYRYEQIDHKENFFFSQYPIGLVRCEIYKRDNIFLNFTNISIDCVPKLQSNCSVSPQTTELNRRSAGPFEDPNLAGHSLVSLGLLGILLSSRGYLTILLSLLTTISVFWTGSRTAWFSLLLGIPWLLWFILDKYWWRKLVFYFIIFSVPLLLWFQPSDLGRLSRLDQSNVTRQSIWSAAVQTIRQHPISGISAEAFAKAYTNAYPKNVGADVRHAHNFWLQMGVQFGLIGFLFASLASVVVLYFVWRWGRWRGLAFTLPFYLMNIFDYTFPQFAVWFSFLIGFYFLYSSRVQIRAKSDMLKSV
jgi:hypothetical protein